MIREAITRGRRHRRALVVSACALVAAAMLVYAALELALRFSPLDPEPYLAVDPSPVLLDRDRHLLHASLNAQDSWSFPRDIEAHSRYLIDATLAAEDQRFWSHHGVDPIAIVRAGLQNALDLDVTSGASTISMQIVKLHTAHPRSLSGKLQQAWNALRLERSTTKNQILTAYLNRAPYGYNLVGAEAAALRYFGKSTAELTLSEAALLAALPKAPGLLDPIRHPDAAKARRDYVLNRMHRERLISDAQLRDALATHLGASWHDLPQQAPHLRMRLPSNSSIQTTLSRHTQQKTQSLLAHYLKQFDGAITNAAAIVIDVETADVLAYCGSADFFKSDGGQMDLARAVRSPGSALKPFVYALAMQKNQVYPSEMLLDDTLDFGDYSPANYDGEFTGLISAEEALRYSLNVPAVQVLDRVGVPAVHQALRELGLTTLDHGPAHYGLGLTLGNCGIRLEELAAAYRALAAMGNYAPLRYSVDDLQPTGRNIINDDIAAATLDMLRQPLPKELPHALVQLNNSVTPVAWKTGTSTGHHDAWAFLFNRHYVVGVWLGNADGRASQKLVGAEVAVPLAATIFRRLPAKTSPAWPNLAQSLRRSSICSSSGLPATPSCRQTRDAYLPRSMYLTRRCDVHHAVTAHEVLQRWPAGARQWNLASVHNPIPLDASNTIRTALRITSPPDAAEYVLTGKPGADRIRLKASLEHDQPVHWYCDGRYLGKSFTSSPVFLDLEAGEHEVACMVSNGTTDSVRITVNPTGK